MWWIREQTCSCPRPAGTKGGILSAAILPLILLAGPASDPRAAFPPARGEAVSPFGKRYLRDVELIAEVTVRAVYHLGLGVDVAKVHPDRVILDLRPRGARPAEPLILAHRDEYLAGSRVLVLLRRFQGGDRMVALHRISPRERDYAQKVRLLETYVRIESIPDRKTRLRALVAAVWKNLEDPNPWVRSNSLLQLRGVVRDGSWRFTAGDVARLRSLAEKEPRGELEKSFESLAAFMADRAVPGPPSVPPPASEKAPAERKEEGEGRRGPAPGTGGAVPGRRPREGKRNGKEVFPW